MTIAQNLSAEPDSNPPVPGATIFKIPIAKLGLFERVLMGGACGAIASLIAFFFAIIGVSIFDSATGRSLANLTISYLYIAAPIGVVVLVAALGYLVTGWARGKIAGAR